MFKSGKKVTILELFKNKTDPEAQTREACMIEAIGEWWLGIALDMCYYHATYVIKTYIHVMHYIANNKISRT